MPAFEFGDKVLLRGYGGMTFTFVAYNPQHAASHRRPVCAVAEHNVSREQLLRICPVAARKWGSSNRLPDGVIFVYAEFLAPERAHAVR